MKNTFLILILFISNGIGAQSINEKKFDNEVKSRNAELEKQNEILATKIQNLNKLIPIIKDSVLLKTKKDELMGIWNIYDSNLVCKLQNDLEFARQNPNSEFSLNLISTRIGSQAAMNLYDEYEKTFNLFSEKIQNSKKGTQLKQALVKFKQSKVGSIAPDFSLTDINGNLIELKNFRNQKYVLIDFWASWCLPCREDNPYFADIYKKFSQKDLEIISISRDENLASWKEAIVKDNMNWTNISITENSSNIEDEYFVQGIPHKVLIDKNGIIIGKWKGSGLKNIYSIRQKLSMLLNKK